MPAYCGPETGAICVYVTPVADFGTEVSTASVELSHELSPGATVFTLHPATVTVTGEFQPVEIEMSGDITGLGPWTMDADEEAGADEVQVYALFTTISRSTRPVDSDFTAPDRLLSVSPKRAGGKNGDGTAFEKAGIFGQADMDSMKSGTKRHLWFRFDAPPVSQTAGPQTLTVTLTATMDDL